MRLYWSCEIQRILIMFAKVDLTVNIFCFYLQFGFSASDYDKYCKLLDYCLKNSMRRNTVVEMQRQLSHREVSSQHQTVASSVSTPTSIDSEISP